MRHSVTVLWQYKKVGHNPWSLEHKEILFVDQQPNQTVMKKLRLKCLTIAGKGQTVRWHYEGENQWHLIAV